jgi:hypothetical protein
MIGGGINALATGVIDLLDWKDLPLGTKARRLWTAHGLTNVVTMSVFLVSLIVRFEIRAIRGPWRPRWL